jgi:hypothetical protein
MMTKIWFENLVPSIVFLQLPTLCCLKLHSTYAQHLAEKCSNYRRDEANINARTACSRIDPVLILAENHTKQFAHHDMTIYQHTTADHM